MGHQSYLQYIQSIGQARTAAENKIEEQPRTTLWSNKERQRSVGRPHVSVVVVHPIAVGHLTQPGSSFPLQVPVVSSS